MHVNELKKIIRESITIELRNMIKEIVDAAVAREFRLLRNELAKPSKTTAVEGKLPKKSFAELMIDEEDEEQQEILNENNRRLFTKSPFADILNNTRPFIKAEEAGVGSFQQQVPLIDRSVLRAILAGDTISATTSDMVSVPLQDPDGRPIDPQVLQTKEGQTVLQNLTKDYSSFMKKVVQKTKQRRGQ